MALNLNMRSPAKSNLVQSWVTTQAAKRISPAVVAPSASSVTRSATAFNRSRRQSSSLSSMHGRAISAGNEIFRALLGG